MEGRNSHHKTFPTTFFNSTAAVLPGKIACFARQYVPFRDAILPVLHRTKPFANAQSDKHMTQQTAGQHFKTAHARMAYLPARMPASTKRRPRRGFCKHCSQQARHHYKAYKIRQAAKPRAGKQKRLAQDAPTWMRMIRSSTIADVSLPMANIAFSIEKSKFSLQKITITFVFILNLS